MECGQVQSSSIQLTEHPRIQPPKKPDTIYFATPTGRYGFLSQWYKSPFTAENGTEYLFAEQYVLHQRALLFNDLLLANLILLCKTTRSLLPLVRRLPTTFDSEIWLLRELGVVKQSIDLKFSKSRIQIRGKSLREHLVGTGEKEIAYARAADGARGMYWGIGCSRVGAEGKRADWGMNWLGFLLKDVRDMMREEDRKVEAEEGWV